MKIIVGIAVAAALSVGAAHAAINPPAAGQGELIEWVVDNTTNQVYARGIQVDETSILPASSLVDKTTYDSTISPGPASTGTTLPTITADANLTTFLAQNGGADSFSYGVLSAGQNTGGATSFNPGASVVVFTSPLSIDASNLNVPSASLIQSNVLSVQANVTTLNSLLGASSAPGSSKNVSGNFDPTSQVFTLYSDNVTLLTPFGTQVNLYAATGDGVKAGTGQLYSAGLIEMTADGTLEAVAASPVPLPAAVWLLGSGLLGLAGVGRRRNA